MLLYFFECSGIAFKRLYQCPVFKLFGFDVAMVAVAYIGFKTFDFLE